MKRSQIDKKYKWKLEDILASDSAWEESFRNVSEQIGSISQYYGRLNNGTTALECLRFSDAISQEIEKLYVYSRMKKDEESLDRYVALSDRAEKIYTQYATASSYIMPQLSTLDDSIIEEYLRDERFCDYHYMLSEIIRNKKYILSEKEERLLSLSSPLSSGYRDVFTMIDNVDISFKCITVGGVKQELNHSNYSLYLQNSNRSVRKAAFTNMYAAFSSLANTIAATYSGSVKADVFRAKARGADSTLDYQLFAHNIPKKVYLQLLDSVRSALPHLHRYIEYRKQALSLKQMEMYDLYVPIVGECSLTLEYEKAYSLVSKALSPLGKNYLYLLFSAQREGWIDVHYNEKKRSGAYSWGVYDTHPYVLLNYQKTTHDVFTIAHELGHAVHSYYSNKTQSYPTSGYAIFVAEVASTVNEVLLLKYLIATSTDVATKKYFLSYYLDMFRTTMFRQTMFSEFEHKCHELEESGAALTAESISDLYYSLNKQYYGKGVNHTEAIRYEWARIPHFYNSYYVYQYATGLTSAVSIASKILSDPSYVEKYFQFLSAGGHKSPYEILRDTGVDLALEEPYQIAIDEFCAAQQELEGLG